MMNPTRWHCQPGKKLGSSLLRKVGLDILDGLTVANAVQLHLFEKKITIAEVLNVKWEEWAGFLQKYSFDKDFKGVDVLAGFVSLRGLLDF